MGLIFSQPSLQPNVYFVERLEQKSFIEKIPPQKCCSLTDRPHKPPSGRTKLWKLELAGDSPHKAAVQMLQGKDVVAAFGNRVLSPLFGFAVGSKGQEVDGVHLNVL